MHRTATLLSRVSFGLHRSPTRSSLIPKICISQRQGFERCGRQFHATPQNRLFETAIAEPLILIIPLAGALPQFIRSYLDGRDNQETQRRLDELGPLVDILSAITKKKRKKLSATAVSTKIDADKLAALDDVERRFKFRVLNKNVDRARWNRTVFLPSFIHTGWSVAAMFLLSIVRQVPEVSSTVIGGGFLTSYLIPIAAYILYINYNPFWSHFTPATVQRINPFWKFLYRFDKTQYDPTTNTVVPKWLYYARYDNNKWNQAMPNKRTPNEIMRTTADKKHAEAMQYAVANGGMYFMAFWVATALEPAAVLYVAGAMSAFCVRHMVNRKRMSRMADRHVRRQGNWMPLGPYYGK